MAQVQAKSSSSLLFSNQKSFSNNIHNRVLKVTQDIIESFDKLEIKDDESEKSFFDEVNHYYRDLTTNIFHLRKITIHIGGKDQSARDLQDVVMSLNKLAELTQESLNLPANELKTKLKNDMVEIGAQVEKLMKIIKYDDLHEYKQKVLDCQHDLVLCVEKLMIYNQLHYLSITELAGHMNATIDKIEKNLVIIKTEHKISEQEFTHYIRHSTQIIQNALDYMRRSRNIENFQGDIQKAYKNAEEFSSSFIECILEAVRFDNALEKMLDIIQNCHKAINLGAVEMEQFAKRILANNPGEKEMEIIKNLIPYLFTSGLAGMMCLNQSLEDAIIKIDMQ